jgi:hypothetical protein
MTSRPAVVAQVTLALFVHQFLPLAPAPDLSTDQPALTMEQNMGTAVPRVANEHTATHVGVPRVSIEENLTGFVIVRLEAVDRRHPAGAGGATRSGRFIW